jgi:hypothetical protein
VYSSSTDDGVKIFIYFCFFYSAFFTKRAKYLITGILLTINGTKFHRKTTAGWQFEVAFKVESVQSTQWIPLKELKESNPVQVAEYVTAKGLASEQHQPSLGGFHTH